jgi:hypothetical protein
MTFKFWGGKQKRVAAYNRTPFAVFGQGRRYIRFLVAKLPFRRKTQGLAFRTELASSLFSSEADLTS